jgi:hypothetical protein
VLTAGFTTASAQVAQTKAATLAQVATSNLRETAILSSGEDITI